MQDTGATRDGGRERAMVSTGARLHFGFCNLSLAHERLYGGIGVALAEPRVTVVAEPADRLDADEPVRRYAAAAVDLLDLPGASVTVESALPRHAGLGSGTQFALATLSAVAAAYGTSVDVRTLAPELGRGGRSGVGVAAFERGGFVVDAGHPSARFTTERPPVGEWTVPAVAAHHAIPETWRFLLVLPDLPPGRSDDAEDESMRAVIERANPATSDRITGLVVRRLLPAVARTRCRQFGNAVSEVDRLNGTWYTDEQGGVYRPPIGDVVASIERTGSVFGAGQSSWGPAVYGVTNEESAADAVAAGRAALEEAGLGGEVLLARGDNAGAVLERGND